MKFIPAPKIILITGLAVAAGVLLMPPWRDFLIPPFGSGEQFGGFGPLQGPHEPWVLPFLQANEPWNPQHEYRVNWFLLGVELAIVGVLTIISMAIATRRGSRNAGFDASHNSSVSAALGGFAAVALGFLGVVVAMSPLLEFAQEARVPATCLLFVIYLAFIKAATWIGANLRVASLLRLFAGLAAGQAAVGYVVFALLPDASADSHRIVLIAWLGATIVGGAAGGFWAVGWVKRSAAHRSAQD